jgi:hypothetical protein
MIIIDCEQNSDEWIELRLGNPGASSMSKIITSSGKPSASADKYLDSLYDEAISGEPSKNFYNTYMQKGHEREQESRNHWQMENNIRIEQVGIVYKDENRYFHASPDGLMPPRRWGFETKNAEPHIQRERLKRPTKIESTHWVQCQMSLYVTGYEAWIYQSYSRNMQPLTIEIYPDLEFIKKMEGELFKFIGKLNNMIKEAK